MKKTDPKVDAYLRNADQWKEESTALRAILLGCGLSEDIKWGKPCYSYQGGNVVIIQGFKAYCALLFFKGALLKDPNHILIKTGENTIVGRQIRFTNVQEIAKLKSILKSYISQAIEIEKAGLKVHVDKKPAPTPKELKDKFSEIPELENAFNKLTPGRQRAYLFYFGAAKQSTTRDARIEKYVQQIFNGKGMDDDYKTKSKKR